MTDHAVYTVSLLSLQTKWVRKQNNTMAKKILSIVKKLLTYDTLHFMSGSGHAEIYLDIKNVFPHFLRL